MNIEEIVEEEFYVWIAPDGAVQFATLAEDEPACWAIAKLLAKQGIGHSPHAMRQKGFSIEKVEVTIT